jgi:CHAD domain-containing protein
VGPKSHQLVALYFDTPDLRLAARGITLRRRRGGTDPGWHLKLPKGKGVRREITHPLTRSAKIVPAQLADLVRAYTRGAELVPVAELDTRRSLTRILDKEGNLLVEVADDRVKGTVLGDDSHVDRWREVEAELAKGDAALLKKVGKRLRKAGASPADAANKLARLLEERLRPVAVARPLRGTAGEVVVTYLSSQVTALLAQDPRVRAAEDDAVHQMRVASRRLRSALKSFRTIVAGTEEIQAELQWLAGVLGEVRDLEVIRARFAAHFATLTPALIVGPVRTRLGADLEAREHDAYERVRETLSDDRYYTLLDALDALVAEPPLTALAAKPADRTLEAIADKGLRRIGKIYDAAQAIEDAERRELAMHDVRKAAKRARYTAETLVPVLGAAMTEMARRAEAVQEILGLYQDSVAAQDLLAEDARAAGEAGEDTFTYGVLVGLERAAAERDHAEFPRVWAAMMAPAVESQTM